MSPSKIFFVTQFFLFVLASGCSHKSIDGSGHSAQKKSIEKCSISPHPEADRLLKDLSWINVAKFSSQSSNPEKLQIKLENCGKFPGGSIALENLLKKSLAQGLSCMAGLGAQRRGDAAKLLTLLTSSSEDAKIVCGSPGTLVEKYIDVKSGQVIESKLNTSAEARATSCEGDSFPSLVINTEAHGSDDYEQVIFHEMLHWLGYKHGNDFDVTYLSDLCCFPGKKGDRAKKACALLADNPPWTSEEYALRFANLMATSQRGVVALRSAWNSIYAQKVQKFSDRDSTNLFVSAMEDGYYEKSSIEKWRITGRPLSGIIFAGGSLENLPKEKRKQAKKIFNQHLLDLYYPTKKERLRKIRNLALRSGQLVKNILNEDFSKINADLKAIHLLAQETCPLLSEGEKEALGDVEFITDLPLVRLFPSVDMDGYHQWISLCQGK